MEYIWLFLLFFAVLAAAWFYLQRAKARPTTTVTTSDASVASAETGTADERTAS